MLPATCPRRTEPASKYCWRETNDSHNTESSRLYLGVLRPVEDDEGVGLLGDHDQLPHWPELGEDRQEVRLRTTGDEAGVADQYVSGRLAALANLVVLGQQLERLGLLTARLFGRLLWRWRHHGGGPTGDDLILKQGNIIWTTLPGDHPCRKHDTLSVNVDKLPKGLNIFPPK